MAATAAATTSRNRLAYRGLRGWLDEVQAMGELLHVNGAHWDAEMGAITHMLTEKSGGTAPAILFDEAPGYPKGFRTLYGHFSSIRRVALTADDRSRAIRLHLTKEQLLISSQNAEEGEANETLQTDYTGEETDIGFNAQYLQEFLNVVGDAKVAFDFKDGNSQAQLKPSENGDYDYKYIVMPMRI